MPALVFVARCLAEVVARALFLERLSQKPFPSREREFSHFCDNLWERGCGPSLPRDAIAILASKYDARLQEGNSGDEVGQLADHKPHRRGCGSVGGLAGAAACPSAAVETK